MTQPVYVLRRLFLPLLWALCTHALAAWPVQVVDDLGREVVMERPPARVVSMVPSHTELLCALGACERLVGRDTWSNYPLAVLSLPDLGSAFAPDLEMLVALRPDLVLVDEYSGLTDALAGLGVVVFAGTAQQLIDIYDIAERVGALLGLPLEAASLIAALQAEVAEVATAVAGRERPQVYYELDPSPYSVGPASYLGTLIELAGGRTIVPAALGDFPLLDPEFVVAANPAVIILGDAMYGIDADLLRQRPGWAAIAAIRTGQVVELNQAESDMLSRAGPRVGAALALLARAFHPGAF